MEPQIKGLPPGAVVKPIEGAPAPQIKGLPPGAVVKPIGTPSSKPAAPPPTADATPPDPDAFSTQASEAATGFKKGLNETGLTAMKAIHSIPVVGSLLDKTKFGESMAETQKNADAPIDTIAGKTGYALENVAEFMSGDEALKGLTSAEKLMKIAPVLKLVEKYPRLAHVLSEGLAAVKANPVKAAAARNAVLGEGQAELHGADRSTAVKTGAITGLIGGAAEAAIPAVYGGVKNLLAKIRPGTEEIAGETVPVLASQRKGAAPIAERAATSSTPAARNVAQAQQEGGQKAIQNIAQRSTRNALEKVNEVRKTAPVSDPARLLQAPEGSKPFEFHIEGPPATAGTEATEGTLSQEGGKSRVNAMPNDPSVVARRAQLGSTADAIPDRAFTENANWHYTPPETGQTPTGGTPATGGYGGGRLSTTDPAAAQAAVSHLEDLHDSAQFAKMPKAQQQQISAARDSLQEQLGMYHAADRLHPHFEPVDAAGLAQHVTNFGEAADHIEASVKPIYQKIDEVSGGKFSALRSQSNAAKKVMFQPGSIKAFEDAVEAKATADKGIQELFNRYGTKVSRPELQSANAAWRDAAVLNNIHATVEGAFKGAPKDIADTLGTNRILRGNSLETRLNRLVAKTPRADIERVIGKDGLENLYRVSDLLSKPETASQTRNAAVEVARELTRRVGKGALIGGVIGHLFGQTTAGAVTGAALEDSARYIMRQAAINPRVGVLIDRAVRNQVNPKIFAPLIAAEINSQPKEESPQ